MRTPSERVRVFRRTGVAELPRKAAAYVNLPGAPAAAQSDSPYFAGVIAPFIDPKHKDHTLRVNVRPALARLQSNGLLKQGELTLTFVPRGPVPPPGTPAPALNARMRVEQLTLVVR